MTGASRPEPAAPPPVLAEGEGDGGRDSLGWVRRNRGRGGVRAISDRYTRLVGALKIGLPLLALILISLVFVWPHLHDAQKLGMIDKSLTAMVNARYMSRDHQGRPFSMTAKSALEVPGHSNLVDLVSPEAEMTQVNGTWVTISAERGRYNQDDGRLLMQDRVHLLRDDGFEFVTDEAEIDTKTGNAWGDRKVVGQGPNGEIKADGFVATDHGQTITFTQAPAATVHSTSKTEGGIGSSGSATDTRPRP